jgi:hypothetical protein
LFVFNRCACIVRFLVMYSLKFYLSQFLKWRLFCNSAYATTLRLTIVLLILREQESYEFFESEIMKIENEIALALARI